MMDLAVNIYIGLWLAIAFWQCYKFGDGVIGETVFMWAGLVLITVVEFMVIAMLIMQFNKEITPILGLIDLLFSSVVMLGIVVKLNYWS